MSKRIIQSHWWFIQKASAFVATVIVAWFLFNLITVATNRISINELKCGYPEMPCALTPFATEVKETYIALPTLNLQEKTSVCLEAIFSTANLPSLVQERITWMLLSNNNGIWREVNTFKSSFNHFENNFEQTGQYVVLVTLPPINLGDLAKYSTEQLKNLLVRTSDSKCKAFQVIFPGKGGNQPPNPTPELDSKPEPEPQVNPKPEDKVDPNQKPQANKEPRDISSDLAGEHDGSGIRDKTKLNSGSEENNIKINAVPYRTGAKPVTEKDVKKLRMEGRLPQVKYFYHSGEILQLGLDDWKLICKQYHMPSFLGPSDNLSEDISDWPILQIDNEIKFLPFDNIKKEYGIQFISLSSFSPEIQEYVKNQFDLALWNKCDEYRGFLLSDLLVTGVIKAFSDNSPPIVIGDIEKVEQIIFDIEIKRIEGRDPTVQITNTKVSMK